MVILYFENGYTLEIRNAELTRVALRNDCTLCWLGDRWAVMFDVARSAGEPYDNHPTTSYVRAYAGMVKLQREKNLRFAKPAKRYYQIEEVDFSINFNNPKTLVIE